MNVKKTNWILKNCENKLEQVVVEALDLTTNKINEIDSIINGIDIKSNELFEKCNEILKRKNEEEKRLEKSQTKFDIMMHSMN